MLRFNTTFIETIGLRSDPELYNRIVYDISCFLPHFKEIYNSNLRYYDIKSGRGGAKTSQLAKIIVKESFKPELKNTNFACGRSFANSIEETSYSTIKLHIEKEGWGDYFKCIDWQGRVINKINNVIMYFLGCSRPERFTSIPNLSRLWLDEIASIDRFTIERIFKSVRGSIFGDNTYKTKIYCSYNPITPLDPITAYLQERIAGGMGLKTHKNIFDLPPEWQDADLLAEAEIDRKNDIDLFNWIWLGQPRPDIQENLFENVIFKDLITKPTQPTIVFVDPSFAGGDTTAVSLVWVDSNNKICCTGYTFKAPWYELDNELLELYKHYNINRFYYESNMLENVVSNHYYEKYGKLLIPYKNTKNKVAKIYKLGYFLKRMEFYNGLSIYNKISHSQSWVKQIQKYNRLVSIKPKQNEHDDAPDSLASIYEAEKWFN